MGLMAAKRTSSGWRADLVVSCLLQDENHTMVVDDMKVKDETRMRVDINAGLPANKAQTAPSEEGQHWSW